jgi:hypothetical protein
MNRLLPTTAFALLSVTTTFGQAKMRPLEELINKTDPGWPLVKEWIASAENKASAIFD